MLIDTRSTRPQAHFPINVMGRDITLSDELREFVQRRLTTALGRFAAKLRDVEPSIRGMPHVATGSRSAR